MEKDIVWRNERNGLLYRIAELDRQLICIREQYQHAVECVDFVFKVDSKKPPPLLPDFIEAGDCKFEGVILLAEKYKQLLKQCEDFRLAIEREAINASVSPDMLARRLSRKCLEFIGSNA